MPKIDLIILTFKMDAFGQEVQDMAKDYINKLNLQNVQIVVVLTHPNFDKIDDKTYENIEKVLADSRKNDAIKYQILDSAQKEIYKKTFDAMMQRGNLKISKRLILSKFLTGNESPRRMKGREFEVMAEKVNLIGVRDEIRQEAIKNFIDGGIKLDVNISLTVSEAKHLRLLIENSIADLATDIALVTSNKTLVLNDIIK